MPRSTTPRPVLTIPVRVDDVVDREHRLGARRAHIDEDEPAKFQRRVGRLPDIHRLAKLLGLARHVEAAAIGVVEPAVKAAAQPLLLDPPPFERGAAMRAMRLQRADLPRLVAEQDDLLAQELFLARQVLQFIRGAHRLPVAAQQFTHRAARLDAGQLGSGWRGLLSVGRLHHVSQLSPAPRLRDAGAGARDVNRQGRYFQFHVAPVPVLSRRGRRRGSCRARRWRRARSCASLPSTRHSPCATRPRGDAKIAEIASYCYGAGE